MLEHEMGGMFDVAHGAGLAAIWGSWVRYVYKNCLDRFVRFARNVMEVEEQETPEMIALRGIEKMEAFYRAIEMPTNMKELGIAPTEEQMRIMAEKCKIAAGGVQGSAMKLDEEDQFNIYKMAR